ncbi:MAG: hypothetical protein LCH56_08460 [Proteobacteria bacterium]|nr:hypothetical protein [Pseudomonadota bacterium]
MKAVCIASVCAQLFFAVSGGPVAGAESPREVFVGFSEPDPAALWNVIGAGFACDESAPRPPGNNRFCFDRVRFEDGSVTLTGEVAALGAVGSAITLRSGPNEELPKIFPSEGTFAAKVRVRNVNDPQSRYASVKAFFTYGLTEGPAHFENDFEIISEGNAFSRDMLVPFLRPLLDQDTSSSPDAVLRRARRTLLPLVTTVTHVAEDGADHLVGGAAPLGRGRTSTAVLVVQNKCIEGCAETGARVYESVYSMALEGRPSTEIGRTRSRHQRGGYDDLSVMFNLWWMKGAELRPPARLASVRQEMQILWFFWHKDAAIPADRAAARGEACDTGKENCPFETPTGDSPRASG